MNTDHFRQLWTALGTVLLFYVVNAWLASVGANPIFDFRLLEDRPKIESLLALAVCAPMLILLCGIGIRHARAVSSSSPDARWHERLPVVWLQGVNTSTGEGRIYQGAFLAAFIVLPATSLWHFLRKIRRAGVLQDDDRSTLKDPFQLVPLKDLGKTHWIGDGLKAGMTEIKGAVTWFPVFEPALLLMLTAAAWISAARLIWALWRTESKECAGKK